MTKLTKGELQVIAETDHVNAGDAATMARMLLDVMNSEPLAWIVHARTGDQLTTDGGYVANAEGILGLHSTPLYRHAQPAPVVPDERKSFESFMAERFGDSVDHRRAKNGDQGYMAWDIVVAWIVWQARAMLQAGNSPVIPEGYCIMPKKLTAENGAKSVLSGEFHISQTLTCAECFGEGCEDCSEQGKWEEKIPVGWDLIKRIYETVVSSCALPINSEEVKS